MSLKTLTLLLSMIIFTASSIQAQNVCCDDDCVLGPYGCNSECSSCGIAYEDTVSTSMLLTTMLVGVAAVTVIAIALVNTPKNIHNHNHGDDSSSSFSSSSSRSKHKNNCHSH